MIQYPSQAGTIYRVRPKEDVLSEKIPVQSKEKTDRVQKFVQAFLDHTKQYACFLSLPNTNDKLLMTGDLARDTWSLVELMQEETKPYFLNQLAEQARFMLIA